MIRSPAITLLVVVLSIAAAGCSWGPVLPQDEPVADAGWKRWGPGEVIVRGEGAQRPAVQAVELATGLIGTPYRWGGATPAGFDCSGLVYYTFSRAGVPVPRTSQEQFRAATPVPVGQVSPGDLVFFGQRGRISHVGIYIGDQRFIHAPESGRAVSVAYLGEPYYQARFAGAGRFD